jgi:hypothetical protein
MLVTQEPDNLSRSVGWSTGLLTVTTEVRACLLACYNLTCDLGRSVVPPGLVRRYRDPTWSKVCARLVCSGTAACLRQIRAFAIALAPATQPMLFIPPVLVLDDSTLDQVVLLSVAAWATALVLHSVLAELWIRHTRRAGAGRSSEVVATENADISAVSSR